MADHRHKRDTNARTPRAAFVAGPIAVLATLSTVGAGVLVASPETRDLLATSSAETSIRATDQSPSADFVGPKRPSTDPSAVELDERTPVISRSRSRIERLSPLDQMLTAPETATAIREADTRLWATAPLDLWTTPEESAVQLGVLDEGTKVLVTGREALGRVEIVVDGESRWVTAGYLSDENPEALAEEAEEAAATLGGACTNGSSVSGQPNVLAVHEAVCASFPELTSYGTYRSDGEHAQGIAIDIMVSGDRGWEVAEFVRANYAELGVSYIIYAQRIWSVERASEGWRPMSDRGSVTANHYDHVHVTTY